MSLLNLVVSGLIVLDGLLTYYGVRSQRAKELNPAQQNSYAILLAHVAGIVGANLPDLNVYVTAGIGVAFTLAAVHNIKVLTSK